MKNYTYTVTSEQIYGKNYQDVINRILKEYNLEIVDFKFVKTHDNYITTAFTVGQCTGSFDSPRFIIKEKTKYKDQTVTLSIQDIYRREVELPDGYEYINFDTEVPPGLYWLDVTGSCFKNHDPGLFILSGPRIILKKSN